MKLARKLTLAILSVIIAVLTINAVERVGRDRQAFREDIRRDHRSLGRALQAVVRESFRDDGEARALALVEAANQQENAIQIRWLWLEDSAATSRFDPRKRAQLERGKYVERVESRGLDEWLLSYVPVRLSDGRLGVLEFSESLASERELVRSTVLRTALSTLLIGGLSALLTSLLGVWLVGRPVAQLMAQARRVGSGDLSGRIELRHRDELGDLALEMNAMSDRLEAASQERQQAIEQLRHADRLGTVGRLAAGVAHELGTPLNVVSIEAKRIATGRAAGEAAQEGAGVIAAQAERMTQIIRQLLDFAGRRTRRLTLVELGGLARETMGLVSALTSRQRIQLEHHERALATVQADRNQLQQVLMNLIVNAVQATEPGGTVLIETGRSPGTRSGPALAAYMRVVDRGTGIAPEARTQIFEPFFTTKQVGQGTGLGLAVAHGIVVEHGGVIDVDSEPGMGAAFTVRLPIAEGPGSTPGQTTEES